jgi:hypothetical protein
MLGLLALAAVAALAGVGPGRGGEATTAAFGYSAKFLCGTLTYIDPLSGQTVEMEMTTAINVHNPTAAYVTIDKKAVQALPETQEPPSPGSVVRKDITPDGAFEIDCADIKTLLQLMPPVPDFLKGFVVIESPAEIDVVGVYTAQRVLDDTTPGVGHSVEVDTIEARTLPPAVPPEDLLDTYPTKFVCGSLSGTSEDPLVPGLYLTAINVHNPNKFTVQLEKKVVLAGPEDYEPYPPTGFVPFTLGPDQAFEIDCADIVDLLTDAGIMPEVSFIKGFVVVAAPAELDVVGVYATTEEKTIGANGGVGVSLDIEPVTKQLVAAPTPICCQCGDGMPFCFDTTDPQQCIAQWCIPQTGAVCNSQTGYCVAPP